MSPTVEYAAAGGLDWLRDLVLVGGLLFGLALLAKEEYSAASEHWHKDK